MRRFWKLLAVAAIPGSLWAGRPAAKFDQVYADFGILPQGSTVQFNYGFRNVGNEPLRIESVQTSCGCTAAAPENPVIAPGETGIIHVTFDSRGKMGETIKQIRVRTNDPKSPMSFLTLAGKIVESKHPEMTDTRNIFKGACRECHVDRGEKRLGEELYMADCAMCHESQSRGGSALGPASETLALLPEAHLKSRITDGVPDTSMPAYGVKKGGPLSGGQIRSLVHYLKSLNSRGGRQ